MNTKHEWSFHVDDYWTLMGIRLNPDAEFPQLCTLLLNAEKDWPLMLEDQIIMFRHPSQAPDILSKYAPTTTADKTGIEKISVYCDIADTLHIIDSLDIDPNATVLDTLNALLDLISGTRFPLPAEIKSILYPIADHLTLDPSISTFLTTNPITREQINSAIYWGLGLVTTRTLIVES